MIPLAEECGPATRSAGIDSLGVPTNGAPHEELAAEIVVEHEHAFGKAREALEHARRCGELLLQAKASIGHGKWSAWLTLNIGFGERTAQNYMQLARRWPALQAKSATVADLTLRGALQELRSDARAAKRTTPLREQAGPEVAGNASDVAAKAVGMSPTTYSLAEAVVAAAESDPETFGDLPELMDETGNVIGIHREMERRRTTPPTFIGMRTCTGVCLFDVEERIRRIWPHMPQNQRDDLLCGLRGFLDNLDRESEARRCA